jgi:hypothetical protein
MPVAHEHATGALVLRIEYGMPKRARLNPDPIGPEVISTERSTDVRDVEYALRQLRCASDAVWNYGRKTKQAWPRSDGLYYPTIEYIEIGSLHLATVLSDAEGIGTALGVYLGLVASVLGVDIKWRNQKQKRTLERLKYDVKIEQLRQEYERLVYEDLQRGRLRALSAEVVHHDDDSDEPPSAATV